MTRQRVATAALLGLLCPPAWAQGEHPGGVLILFIIYGFLAASLLGWSVLVLLTARARVERTFQTLGQRPLASFVMGLLCCGWLLLSLGLAKALPGVGGLLVLVTLSVLTFCSLLGLPAILLGVGTRAHQALGTTRTALHQLGLGALILFSAGSLPWLGWLMLAGVAIWACGGAVLALLAGEGHDHEHPSTTSSKTLTSATLE